MRQMPLVYKFVLCFLLALPASNAAIVLSCSCASAADEVRVPILLYHNIMEDYDPAEKILHCSPADFETHMRALQDAGYTTIDFAQYRDYVQKGTPLPPKPVIVTFDDGYLSNYEYAYPTLKKLGMKGTIFVITGRMGVSDTAYPHFTWEQAREMEQSGVIDIESHTDTHPHLEDVDAATLALEIRRSYYLLATKLNKTPVAMAYPYGLRQQEAAEAAAAAGFSVQCLVGDRGVNTRPDGLSGLKRLSVSGGMTGTQLLQMIADNMDC